jgi:hypothetical protein
MGATQIKEWFNRFRDGHTLADSDQRSGRPSQAGMQMSLRMCAL